MGKQKAGLYFHIPFCKGKCPYCDFYSCEYSLRAAQLYVRAAAKQIESFPKLQIDSIYFGGGTPSLMSAGQIYALVTCAREHFVVAADCEITMEANPADILPARLPYYIDAGVNRLSVGVQSLNDEVLAMLGRRHTATQARLAVEQAVNAGIKNVSADLMLALPSMTPKSAAKAAQDMAQLPVSHISAYMLKINEGTPFGLNPPANLPDDDTAADEYLAVHEALTDGGFSQYEISNYTRGDRPSRHNLKYWQCADYAGIGPAAHSCIAGKRWFYPSELESYLTQDFSKSYSEYLSFSGDVNAQDLIICALRTNAGLNLQTLKQRFNFEFSAGLLAKIQHMCDGGLMTRCGDTLALTLKGMLVSNSILSELI